MNYYEWNSFNDRIREAKGEADLKQILLDLVNHIFLNTKDENEER